MNESKALKKSIHLALISFSPLALVVVYGFLGCKLFIKVLKGILDVWLVHCFNLSLRNHVLLSLSPSLCPNP